MEPRREPWKQEDRPYTAEDLYEIASVNGERYELIEGCLYVSEPPGMAHGYVESNVALLVGAFVRERKLGRFLVGDTGFFTRGDNRTVRGPDASFVSYRRYPPGPLPEGFGTTPPDLVVEVLSPDDRPGEVKRKTDEWLAFGVRVAWTVDPRQRTVQVSTQRGSTLLGEDDTLTGGEVLPGFAAPVAALFEG